MTIGPLSRTSIGGGCSYGDGLITSHESAPGGLEGHLLFDVEPIVLPPVVGQPPPNPLGEAPWRLFCPNGDCGTCRTHPCATVPTQPQRHLRLRSALSFGQLEIHAPGLSLGPFLMVRGDASIAEVRASVSAWTLGHANVAVQVYKVVPAGEAPIGSVYLAIPVIADPAPPLGG